MNGGLVYRLIVMPSAHLSYSTLFGTHQQVYKKLRERKKCSSVFFCCINKLFFVCLVEWSLRSAFFLFLEEIFFLHYFTLGNRCVFGLFFCLVVYIVQIEKIFPLFFFYSLDCLFMIFFLLLAAEVYGPLLNNVIGLNGTF